MRAVNLAIHKEAFSFSAGHFTIFSATEREALHGHNYMVSVTFNLAIEKNGLSFDYRYYKNKINKLCESLDRHFILPSQSPFLKLKEQDEYWAAYFNHKKLLFLKEDVIILPLTNITIEELSHWFLQKILEDKNDFTQHAINGLSIEVFNGPCQSAKSEWKE